MGRATHQVVPPRNVVLPSGGDGVMVVVVANGLMTPAASSLVLTCACTPCGVECGGSLNATVSKNRRSQLSLLFMLGFF